jgi:hypothetical protein
MLTAPTILDVEDGGTMAASGGSVQGEVRIGGRQRTFALRLPGDRATDGPTPLVALHGRGGTGRAMRHMTASTPRLIGRVSRSPTRTAIAATGPTAAAEPKRVSRRSTMSISCAL